MIDFRLIKNFWLLCLASICGYQPVAADVIKTNTGEMKNIVVQKETYKIVFYYLKIDPKKTPQSLETSKIVQIIREVKNPNYDMGEDLFGKKLYKEAFLAYKRAADEQSGSEKQHPLFKMAQCQYFLGNLTGAIATYRRLQKQFPDSFYLPETCLQLAECLMAQKKWKEAASMLNQAGELYQEIKKDAEFWEVTYTKGILQERQNNIKEAISLYQNILSKADRSSQLKQKSHLRLAHCWLEKDDEKAKEAFVSLLEKTNVDNQPMLAGIYVGLGHYYLKKQEIKQALLCYLRPVMLYSSESEYASTAYLKAAYCYELLKDQNPSYRSRAKQLKDMQRQKFGQQ